MCRAGQRYYDREQLLITIIMMSSITTYELYFIFCSTVVATPSNFLGDTGTVSLVNIYIL